MTETTPSTCQAKGCTRPGRPYTSGVWCDEKHAPWNYAEGRVAHQGTRYCAPKRCYCGYCPCWEPPADIPHLAHPSEISEMIRARQDLAAKAKADLEALERERGDRHYPRARHG
jgi:hypothetical protein